MINTAGFIYIISSTCHIGLYKIGITKDPVARFKQFNNSLPEEMLRYVFLFYNNEHGIATSCNHILLSTEKKVHALFASKRVKHEWFNLSKSDLDLIEQLIFDSGYSKCDDENVEYFKICNGATYYDISFDLSKYAA